MRAKKAFEMWKDMEVKIHIDKSPGRDRSNMVFNGCKVGILTALTSAFNTLVKYSDIKYDDLRNCIDVAETKGDNNESE